MSIPRKKIIAVDFDGTITDTNPFPKIGTIRPEAVPILKQLRKYYILILWTCREGYYLKEAVDLLNKNEIFFDYINECPIGSRKVVADYYIDDRAFGGIIDWKVIGEYFLGSHSQLET